MGSGPHEFKFLWAGPRNMCFHSHTKRFWYRWDSRTQDYFLKPLFSCLWSKCCPLNAKCFPLTWKHIYGVFLKCSVLAIYSYIKNYPQTWWFKTTMNIYYLSWFLWVRNSRVAWWVVLAQRLLWSYSQDVGYSHLKTGAGGFTSKMAPSHGWHLSAGCWQNALGPLHIVPSRGLLECSYNTIANFPENKKSKSSRWKPWCL